MFLIFDLISGILTGLLGLIVVMVFVPVIVQAVVHMIINMINNTLKTNIRPMLNLLFFPGAMLRSAFIFMVLSMMGWKVRMSYGRLTGLKNPTTTNNRFSGFGIYMLPPLRGVKTGQTIIISLSGYFVWLWVLLFMKYQLFISRFMAYLWGADVANTVYMMIVLSLVIGGMPIPEETMLPLNHLVAYYPHLVIAAMIGFIGAAIVGGLFGVAYAQIYFGILMAILIVRHKIDARELERLDPRVGLGELNIEEVMIY